MLPHVPTLTLATLAVAAILGLLLLCTWLQSRNEKALLYWGAAGLAGAAGMAILVADKQFLPFGSTMIAHTLFIVWAGLTWCGARRFSGRESRVEYVLLAVVVWVSFGQFEIAAGNVAVRVSLVSILRATFTILAMIELWRGREEWLFSRWAAIVTLAIHAVALLARVPIVTSLALPPEPELFQSGWFGAAAMGQLLYTIGIAFVLLAMTKERAELRQKHAARTDSLTALLNRRAFTEEGLGCLRNADRAVAVLAFDLDNFKSINDRFGHAAGDRVLQRFAATLRAELERTDIAGRLGGEEFAALLPGADQRIAIETAERVRKSFAAGAAFEGSEIATTVSVGIAMATRSRSLDEVLAEADRAVYTAKRAGRNCVRVAGAGPRFDVGRKTAPSAAA